LTLKAIILPTIDVKIITGKMIAKTKRFVICNQLRSQTIKAKSTYNMARVSQRNSGLKKCPEISKKSLKMFPDSSRKIKI
jgi:hypothetical protein